MKTAAIFGLFAVLAVFVMTTDFFRPPRTRMAARLLRHHVTPDAPKPPSPEPEPETGPEPESPPEIRPDGPSIYTLTGARLAGGEAATEVLGPRARYELELPADVLTLRVAVECPERLAFARALSAKDGAYEPALLEEGVRFSLRARVELDDPDIPLITYRLECPPHRDFASPVTEDETLGPLSRVSRTHAPAEALSALAGVDVEAQVLAVAGITAPDREARVLEAEAEIRVNEGSGLFHAPNGRIVIEVECEASGLGRDARLVLRLVYESAG